MSESEPDQGQETVSANEIRCKGFLSKWPFAHILIGALYHHDCPVQPYIPIYLEVMGIFQILLLVLSMTPYFKNFKNFRSSMPYYTPFYCLLILFFLCWFIVGNVWIYSIYEPSYKRRYKGYCNETLYQFAFWITNVSYMLMALFIGCYAWCCYCGKSNDNEVTEQTMQVKIQE